MQFHLAFKKAVSVGIGLFILVIGLQNAGLVVDSSTLVTITDFTKNFHTAGITALLAVIGVFVYELYFILRELKAQFLLVSYEHGFLELYVNLQKSMFLITRAFSVIPTRFVSFDFSALGKTFGQCFNLDFKAVGIVNFIIVVFAFLFVDLFDTLGTIIGVSTKAGMLDENGKLPNIKPALLSDAIATSAGAILGTSTTTTFVESSAGVAEGGRTGLTAVITGVLFLVAVIFSPLFITIPSFATAPALIMVGFLMFGAITDIKFTDENLTEAIPAYLCIIAMPLFYSISEGISVGIISYVLLNLVCGKAKKVKPLLYVLALLFVLKYIFL